MASVGTFTGEWWHYRDTGEILGELWPERFGVDSEGRRMALAGGACTAYRLKLVAGQLEAKATTLLRALCLEPHDAVAALRQGREAVVAGGDVWLVREMVKGEGHEG